MEPFDNLKGKLREESPLPEGFGWDDMQEGIFEKMENLTIPKKEPKQFGYWKLTFFLFGMLAMLGLTVLFHLVTDTQKEEIIQRESLVLLSALNSATKTVEKTKTTTKKEYSYPEKSTEVSLNTDQNYPTEIISKSEEKATNSLTSTSLSAKETAKIDKREINGIAPNRLNNQFSIPKKEAGELEKIVPINQHNNISPNIKNVGQETKPAPPTAFNNYMISEKTENSRPNNQQRESIWTLTSLRKEPLKPLDYLHLIILDTLSLSNPLAVEKRNHQTRFSMAFGAGVNYWTPNWGGTTGSQERATYEKALIGTTYSLQLDYQLKPNWALASGIVWSRNYSKFDYYQTDTYQKVKQAAVVEIQVNTFTGDSTQIYGDQTVNVERTRKVVHYNSFQKWAIPVSIKYSLRHRQMEYTFGIGTMFTLSTKTTGKTFNQTITDYNAANPIYKTGLEIGAMGSFDLNYHFSNKYFIGAQLSAVKSLGNWSQTEEVMLKPMIFHSQLRIGRKF